MSSDICRAVLEIPPGKVATYGQVAAAAGYPRYHRQVVQVLGQSGGVLPWYRVVGAGGRICLPPDEAHEQRELLELEGVRFDGARVRMKEHQYTWQRDSD